MAIRVVDVSYYVMTLRTRMPFRYGIASLTACPHLFVRVEAEVDGRRQVGLSADNLPPKWFTKDPGTSYEADLGDMVEVIRAAGHHAVDVGEHGSVFELWAAVYETQKAWAAGTAHPPLLWNFGVSLIERAVIDAFCRGKNLLFQWAVAKGLLGVAWSDSGDKAPARATDSFVVRHTVGLSDPLTAADVAAGGRIDDGLPQTLEESIDAYGLRSFKIKLAGDVTVDLARLRKLAELLEGKLGGGPRWEEGTEDLPYRFTLDGNENFRDLSSLRQLWSELTSSVQLRRFLTRLWYLEQPLHRDVALSVDLKGWEDRPPVIIDESDADLTSLQRALELGYVGTSHKNCKGVFKGLKNAATLARQRREQPGRPWMLSGEDLTNIGPVALLQDLAVMAALGITDVERNGQHYVRGLDQFPDSVQVEVATRHFDLYKVQRSGFVTPKIVGGRMSARTVNFAPFGYMFDFDPADHFPRLDDRSIDSLSNPPAGG